MDGRCVGRPVAGRLTDGRVAGRLIEGRCEGRLIDGRAEGLVLGRLIDGDRPMDGRLIPPRLMPPRPRWPYASPQGQTQASTTHNKQNAIFFMEVIIFVS